MRERQSSPRLQQGQAYKERGSTLRGVKAAAHLGQTGSLLLKVPLGLHSSGGPDQIVPLPHISPQADKLITNPLPALHSLFLELEVGGVGQCVLCCSARLLLRNAL